MAFDNNVVLVGNVTRDPELRFTQGGAAVCSFGLAWNQRSQQGEDKAHTIFRVGVTRKMLQSVSRGMRVVVYGRSTTELGKDKRREQISSSNCC